jgi:menaquinone-9 beta-reductase
MGKFDADVAIIGASLAGASAAIRLAQHGHKVLLFDRAQFPRNKPCGEGLSSFGKSLFSEVVPSMNELPQVPFSGYQVVLNSKTIDLDTKEEKGVGIQRIVLDAALATEALENNNIDFHLNESISNVELKENSVILQGKVRYRVRTIFVADGVNSRTAATFGTVRKISIPDNRRYSITFVLESPQKATNSGRVTIFPLQDSELYSTPVGNNLINVAVLGTRKTMHEIVCNQEKMRQTLSEFYGCELKVCRELLGAGPVSTLIRKSDKIFLLGDAGETFDPIGGMGMTHALLSAKIA